MNTKTLTLILCTIMIAVIAIAVLSVINKRADNQQAVIWDMIAKSGDAELVTLYLGNTPDSPYQAEATELLRSLLREREVSRVATDLLTTPNIPTEAIVSQDLTPDPKRVSSYGLRLHTTTLPQLLSLSPRYPPIRNLRKDVWTGKQCRDCHKWTAPALCDQARTYTEADFNPLREKQHPLGVDFKLALRQWALDGCQ